VDPNRIWYVISSIILAALLFRPVKKLIFVQRIRRAEAKLKRALTEGERKEIEKKTVPLAAIITLTFAFLFNGMIMGKYYFSK
jgi:hypothetical protein